MEYSTLKLLHQGLVVVSVTGFMARWGWRLTHPAWKPVGVVRAAPHVLDTLLLGTGVVLAYRWSAEPWSADWLVAKLAGVVAYIVLAWIAYRSVNRPKRSLVAGLTALLVIVWVASVAVGHHPAGFLA